MNTPATRAGLLTDAIMGSVSNKLPNLPVDQFNRIYEAVLQTLSEDPFINGSLFSIRPKYNDGVSGTPGTPGPTTDRFHKLDFNQRALLEAQRNAMATYLSILRSRIKMAREKASNEQAKDQT